jgi:hypothetical protein
VKELRATRLDRTYEDRCLVIAVAAASLVAAAPASAYASFTSWVTSANVWSYTTPNRLDVRGYASYRDYDCTPSYQCDRNVMVEFELRRGYSSYSPLVARDYDETGQYGSSVDARFQLPSCRFIQRYGSQAYTIVMTAVAPDGREKTSTRTVYQRSCRL